MQSGATTTRPESGAHTLYDRFAGLYDLTFKFNRYGRSLERYLRETQIPLSTDARILDAGCGTGLLTLALLRVLERPARITAVDLSVKSLRTAREAVRTSPTRRTHSVSFAQANVLALPFADETFEFVVTSGVLEYVPLAEGLKELSRVVAPGGYLLHLPVRPSMFSRLLEVMFRFKAHPPAEVESHTLRHFRILDEYHFPPLDPIGWTKTAILSQKR
ncbi:MAG TPA: class I SAM-dependent methyltransferase [Pyrinomonadaceae bacterium]|nr:class I SAM-dependent methyltransferase [Pyrinomonadaceae bacterium]